MEKKDRFYKDLPLGDVEWLRKLVYKYRDNPNFSKQSLFSHALLGYYDVMWSGLESVTADLIYRLSDFVPEDERKTMHIYPSPDGSIVRGDGKWDSLEDWREQWEKHRRIRLKSDSSYTPLLPLGTDDLGRIIGSHSQ